MAACTGEHIPCCITQLATMTCVHASDPVLPHHVSTPPMQSSMMLLIECSSSTPLRAPKQALFVAATDLAHTVRSLHCQLDQTLWLVHATCQTLFHRYPPSPLPHVQLTLGNNSAAAMAPKPQSCTPQVWWPAPLLHARVD